MSDHDANAETPTARREDDVRWLERVLEDSLLSMHFQPIVDLRSGTVFAYEALTRPRDGFFNSPQQIINAGIEAERIGELGRLQRSLAVKGCTTATLFLNIEPHEFDQPWLVRPDDPMFRHPHPVYLEITENVPLKYFAQCHSVLAELRKKRVFLAIDDFGAGFSNLKYIAELKPEIVKLDRELIRDCRAGSPSFSLLKSITSLCHRMQAQVIAEGVETRHELSAVLGAGVDYAQGYLLARPAASPPEVDWPRDLPEHGWTPSPLSIPETTDQTATTDAKGIPEQRSKGPDTLAHEVKTLTDLLMQSEMGRMDLLRRLKAAAKRSTADLSAASLRAETSPSDTTTASSPPQDSAREVASSGKPRRRRVTALAAALLLVMTAAWILSRRPHLPAQPTQEVASVAPPRTPSDRMSLEESATAAPESSVTLEAVPASEAGETSTVTAIGQPLDGQPRLVADGPAPSSEVAEPAAAADAIANRVQEWARAWSEQRVQDYLAFYALDYDSVDGLSRREWANLRKERLERPEWISVAISDLEIRLPQPDRAITIFTQTYTSPGYSDEVIKTLAWKPQDGKWRITSEQSSPK